MSNWKLSESDQSTFIYELGEDGINKWNCDVQPGFSGGERASSEYLHSVALKMRAADELYEALDHAMIVLFDVAKTSGLTHSDAISCAIAAQDALAKARGEM